MTDRDRELARVRNPVLVTSAVAWLLLLVRPGALAHCAVAISGGATWRASLQMFLAMNRPVSLAAGWVLMLVAMMTPVLIPPIRHVRLQSFSNRRVRAAALFVGGYAAIWLAASAVLLTIEVAAALFARQSYAAVAAALAALIWQFSPARQHCLNRGHAHPALAAFGPAADHDALRFGITHGIWCVGSCWALMTFSMLLPLGNVAAMGAVAFLIVSEQLDQPARPRWNWRLSTRLTRLIVSQIRIRLNAPRVVPAGLSSNGFTSRVIPGVRREEM